MPYVRRNAEGRIAALLAESAPDATESLPSTHPEVLAFFDMRFQVLKLAERLAIEPTPPPPAPEPKSRLTPEEWAARIERYRQRSLTRKRVRFEDHKADVMQDLDMLQEFVDDLGQYPLDEDERERLITEFKERLLGGDEESSNGFKQL